jgi:hypothetical protein
MPKINQEFLDLAQFPAGRVLGSRKKKKKKTTQAVKTTPHIN